MSLGFRYDLVSHPTVVIPDSKYQRDWKGIIEVEIEDDKNPFMGYDNKNSEWGSLVSWVLMS